MQTTKELKLLSCPNCGHEPIVQERNKVYRIECVACGMSGPSFDYLSNAKEAWNLLPRNLDWTKTKPKLSGWYWWRLEKNTVPHMVYVVWESVLRPVQVDRMVVLYPNTPFEFSVAERKGEWAGPLLEP